MPLWSYAHPSAIQLAERLAGYAPGDLNRVFFTSGGGEAVESAWKLAKNYFKLTGKPMKHKVISRAIAYHGTTQGALSITGLPMLKQQFEPLVPSTFRVPNTNLYRAAEITGGFLDGSDPEAFGRWAADQIAVAIENEGPDTVAAVFLEPVQNAGGCFPPPPGYFNRVREICDEYDVLLVSDEVICAFGRLGYFFGAERFGYQPDIITCAKGITSGYAPLGAMIASDRLMEPFQTLRCSS
jgi:adenosylmethionine-8-amino-7-oxononanoate aminotransferase